MSTRSTTVFLDKHGTVIVQIYKHSNGYYSRMGKELATFLDNFQILNGVGREQGKAANRIGNLAAQMIAYFQQKDRFTLEIITPDEFVEDAEFFYFVQEQNGVPQMKSMTIHKDIKDIDWCNPQAFLKAIET